jgi:hypothetical protein
MKIILVSGKHDTIYYSVHSALLSQMTGFKTRLTNKRGLLDRDINKPSKLRSNRFLFSSWLRHYATSWMVVGSNPDEVIGFFN